MLIKFKRLTLKGFRSFSEEATLSFEREPGLYFIAGQNDLEPSLGGNGVGKSTLFEGLFWIIFNKTSLGLRASNIPTWGSTACSGTLEFDIDEESYTLTRTAGPNRLTLNGKDVTQEAVETLLQLTPELASSSLHIGQFTETFVELPNAKRLEVFSDLMKLSRWENYSNIANGHVSKLEKQITQLSTKIAQERGRLSEVNVDKMKSLYESWEQDRTARLKELEHNVETTEEKLKLLTAELHEIEEDQQDLETELAALPVDMESEEAYLANYPMPETPSNVIAYQLSTTEKELKAMHSLAPICPVCKQGVDESHRASHIAQHEKMHEKIMAELKAAKRLETARALKLTEYNEKIREKNKVSESINAQLRKIGIRHAAAKANVSSQAQVLTRLIKEHEELQSSANSYQSLYETAVAKKKEIEGKLAILNTDHTEVSQLLDDVSYWVGGYKKIRLFSIKQALSALEMMVNDGLMQLGLKDWAINLEAERELAKGGIRREFVINVQSPYNDELVPWEAWSGGERQRLRLAFLFGLSSMMADRLGRQMNIMFLDEPTTWLSEAGITDMLEFLKAKAEREQIQIWIADHRTLEFGGFAGTVKVRKTITGSLIEE